LVTWLGNVAAVEDEPENAWRAGGLIAQGFQLVIAGVSGTLT